MRYINWATALLILALACPAQAVDVFQTKSAKPDVVFYADAVRGTDVYYTTVTASNTYHFVMCVLDPSANPGIIAVNYQLQDPDGTWFDYFTLINGPAATTRSCILAHEQGASVSEPAGDPCPDVYSDNTAPVAVPHRWRITGNTAGAAYSFKCFYK